MSSFQYEQSIADMLQKQTLRLDESQEGEFSQLRDRLQYELNILTAYQEKNRLQAQAQRDRERKELEDRVSVRRGLLESKVRLKISFWNRITDLWITDGDWTTAVQPGAIRASSIVAREAGETVGELRCGICQHGLQVNSNGNISSWFKCKTVNIF